MTDTDIEVEPPFSYLAEMYPDKDAIYSVLSDVDAFGKEILDNVPNHSPYQQDTSADRWSAARVAADQQAVALRVLADHLEETHIPFTPMSFTPALRSNVYQYGAANFTREEAQRFARIGAAFVSQVVRRIFPGAKREQIRNEYQWGLSADIGGGFKFKYTTPKEITCEIVPLLNEDGTPKMVTSTQPKYVNVEVTTQATERKCISIFGD